MIIIFVVLLRWLIIVNITVTDELLVTLLLLHSLLLLLHLAHLSGFSFGLSLSLSFFLLDALLLLFLASALRFLLFLAASFLFSALSLLFSLSSGGLLLGGLSLHLLSHGLFLLGLGLSCATITRGGATSEDLLYVRRGVNARSGGSEHGLEENVGFLRLVTRDNFGWFYIDLLTDDKFRQLDKFDEELNLGVFLSD